jgi:hypothetical protein
LKRVGELYLYVLLLFSPFVAYLIDVRLNLIPYYLIGTITSIFAVLMLFRSRVIFNKIILLYTLLFTYYFLWSFYNGRFEEFGLIKILFKSLTLHTIGFLIICENVRLNKKTITYFVKGIKFLIILSTVFSFVQLFFNPKFFSPYLTSINPGIKPYEIRNWSIWGFLDPNDVGLSFLAIVVIAVSYDLLNKKQSYYIWLLLGFFVSFATNARYVMINMTLIIIYAYFQGTYKFKVVRFTIFSMIAIFLLFYIFSKLSYTPQEYYEERILSTSAESRIYAIDLFEKYFIKSPWFGSGLRVTEDLQRDIAGISSQIHVGFLSHLYEFGIVGSILLFSTWGLILKRFYTTARRTKFYGSFIAFICFLVANIALVEYSIFHVGLLFAFVFDKYYRNYSNENNSFLKTR